MLDGFSIFENTVKSESVKKEKEANMPHIVTAVKRTSSSASSGNYSHCPLKKRPIKYDPVEDSDSDVSYKGIPSPQPITDCSEPENLSTKPEDLKLKVKQENSPSSASSSASLSPPPLSLVAGRGGMVASPLTPAHSFCGSPTSSPPHYPTYQSHHYQQHHPSQYSPGYLPLVHHPSKPMSGGGPLEPISLNPPAAWSKIAAPAQHIHHNYPSPSPPTTASVGQQRSSYLDFVSSTSPPSSSHYNSSRAAPVLLPQFPSQSHYAPFSGRDSSGSPPHVSPPLTVEPAYPVIKIEEAHRGSRQPFSHQHLNSQTKFYEEIITPVAAHQHQHHHHLHQNNSLKPKEHCYPSPPHSYQSTESRDSVISHSSVSSSSSSTSNSQNQQPVAPPPQLSQITPINVNGSVRYQCPDCNKSYSTFSGLSKHIQFHCASQNKKQFICKFCEKVYVSLGALKMHIRTHTLPCKCNMCGKAFSRPWLLQGHIRTHTGEKPFSCQHCNRAFADRSNLRAHLQTHSEVKKYSCKHCSKTFSRMSLLVKHEDGGCNAGVVSPQNQNQILVQ